MARSKFYLCALFKEIKCCYTVYISYSLIDHLVPTIIYLTDKKVWNVCYLLVN